MIYTAYIRVSDTNRADGETQRNAIQQYANSNGLLISKWVEEHISATKTEIQERKLMQCVENGESIVVADITRLGRRKVMQLVGVVARIAEHGELHLAYSDRVIDSNNVDDAETLFTVVGQSFAAAEEGRKRSERAKAAHARRKAQGLHSGRKVGAVVRSKLDDHAALILSELSRGTAKTKIVALLASEGVKVTRKGLYDWIKRRTL